MLSTAHMQWVRETEIPSWQFLSAVKGCVGCSERMCWMGVMWGQPYWNSHCFSSIDFGRNLCDTEPDIEGWWPPLLPREVGSQELHWRLFLIDFKSGCCDMDHINLAGWRQQSSTTGIMALGWLSLGHNPFAAAGWNPGGKCLWQMTQTISNFQKLCWGFPGAGGVGTHHHHQKLQAGGWPR